MYIPLLLLLTLTSVNADPVAAALERYRGVGSYQVTLRSRGDSSEEVIRYYYKRPGFVRMEFVKPHRGAVLVYDPVKKEVRLRPFDFIKSFVMTLSPDSSLIKSRGGHTVAESDIGTLLKSVRALQDNGRTQVLKDEEMVWQVAVEGEGSFTANGVHRYLLWIDKKLTLPVKASAYNVQGEMIEEVVMDDLEVDVAFEEGFFQL